MEITISHKGGFSGHKYCIFEGDRQTHTAAVKSFSWSPETNLLDSSGKPVLTIKRSWSFFKVSYEIRRNKDTLSFKTMSAWKRNYQCMVGKNVFDIKKSKGRQYEIYKDDAPVAGLIRKSDGWFKGYRYTITAGNEQDRELLIAFCLIIDNIMINDQAAAAVAAG
jgi:uncharacterized protein YxjI